MLNVGIAIDAFAVSITRTRKAAGSYNADGEFISGGPSALPIRATIQPVSGRELKDMPEGIRNEARWLIWSRTDIVVDDTVAYRGDNYRILFVWPREEGGFYRAAMGLLK